VNEEKTLRKVAAATPPPAVPPIRGRNYAKSFERGPGTRRAHDTGRALAFFDRYLEGDVVMEVPRHVALGTPSGVHRRTPVSGYLLAFSGLDFSSETATVAGGRIEESPGVASPLEWDPSGASAPQIESNREETPKTNAIATGADHGLSDRLC